MSLHINIPEYNVSQFNQLIKGVIETNFDYVRIKGEISEIKTATRGQLYLTLKDEQSILSGVIWNTKKNFLKFKPEEGMEVVVIGKITTWSKFKTTYQIDIDTMELAGEGALLKLIEDRKKKLKAKGLFDQEYKKKLPYLPKKIGVITSPTGSVIHDIINRIKDRCPVDIDIWPVSVQGPNAAESIIKAINGFHSKIYEKKPDIIIIARGGGSIEDLMAFNDENLAMAVFNASIPIISAIGHETDTTIIDYVSDLRASTPTAAAEKSVPIRLELEQSLNNIFNRLNYAIDNNYNKINSNLLNLGKYLKAPDFIINSFKERAHIINNNLLKEFNSLINENYRKINNFAQLIRSPKSDLINKKKYFINIFKNFEKNINDLLALKNKDLNKYTRLLQSNSINSALNKGYSIVRKSNKIIKKSNLMSNEDLINIQFLDKKIDLKIKKI